jgi:DNA-binding MarR family transcriptional regulator
MTVGMFLLSTLKVTTPTWQSAIYTVILGLGLGMVMQVLVLAVQNAVDYKFLGVATSGSVLFRQVGGSIGVAVFGAIFTNRLTHELATRLPRGAHIPAAANPVAVKHLPAAVHAPYIASFAAALRPVFLAAAGISLLGFIASLFLKEVPLRKTAAADGTTQGMTAPREESSERVLERLVGNIARKEERQRLYEELIADSGIDITPADSWALGRIAEQEPISEPELIDRFGLSAVKLHASVSTLRQDGYVDGNGTLSLTGAGRDAVTKLWAARRERLNEWLGDWGDNDVELSAACDRLAKALTLEPPE